jgi:carotenoid cleavage dioxygenase-like enzyme
MVAFIGHHFIFGIDLTYSIIFPKESKLILSSNKSNNTAISVLKISVMSNDIEKRTKINIFNAKKLSDDLIAVAKLPYVLPLGSHGKYINL